MSGIEQVDIFIVIAAQQMAAVVRVHQTGDVGSSDLGARRQLHEEREREDHVYVTRMSTCVCVYVCVCVCVCSPGGLDRTSSLVHKI